MAAASALLAPSCRPHGGDGAVPPAPPPPLVPAFLASDVRIESNMPPVGGIPAAIASSGLNVYVAWIDERNGGTDVYFNRSFDGGTTWLATSIRMDHDVASTATRSSVRLACVGLSVYAAWGDQRNGNTDIYFNRSLDGGTAWLPADVRLDGGTAYSGPPDLCCDGATIHVAWEDARNGARDIYYNRSGNGGATWLVSDRRLDTDAPGTGHSQNPRICCDGGYVYACWTERRPAASQPDIYGNASTDGGLTWRVSDYRIETDTAGATMSWIPAIACSGPRVYVAWEDQRNGKEDIYFNVSPDAGATWGVSDQRLDRDTAGASISRQVHLRCAGANVYAAWEDFRNGSVINVYFNRSTDGGSTWLASDLRLQTNGPGASNSYLGDLACSGNIVCAVWQDDRAFASEIRFNYSNDGGGSWAASDLRLDTDGTPTAFSGLPTMSQDGRNVYVVWPDARVSLFEVFFNRTIP